MIRDMRIVLGLGIATFVLLGATSVAHAQYQPPPPPPPGYYYPPPPPPRYAYPPPPPPRRYGVYRDGLVLGVGLGIGGISASDCGDTCGVAGALEMHLGGMINPRLALMGDVWFNGRSVPNSDVSVVHTIYTFAAQYWATENLWLKGGIGGGNMHVSSDSVGDLGDEDGLAIMVAGGVEFLQLYNFAMDAQLRFGHGFYSEGGDVNSWALMIGFNWF